MRFKLDEASRNNLITKSKSSPKGLQRFKKRTKSRIANSVREFNSMDMNKLFKEDILSVNINVSGETNNYIVRVSFGGFLDELHRELKNNNGIIDLRIIIRSLVNAFNRDDVYVNCTCPDFCLTGDNKIKLLNNEVITIAEMLERFENGEQMYVYSTDEKGDFKPGKVTDVWVSGLAQEAIRITLDNGREIVTTPNHRYMCRNGEYKRADEISVGDSLMPLYFAVHDGYESVMLNSHPKKFVSVYKTVSDELLQEEIKEAENRTGEEAIQIHHKDFNKLNNYPSNLYPMGALEHWYYHANHVKESGQLEKFMEAGHAYWATEEGRKTKSEEMSRNMKKYYASLSDDEKQVVSERNSKQMKDSWARGCFDTDKFREAGIKRAEKLHTPEIEARTTEGVRNYWKNLTGEKREKRLVSLRANIAKATEKMRGVPFSDEHKAHIREAQLRMSPEEKQQRSIKAQKTKIFSILCKLVENGEALTEENYDKYRTNGYPRVTKHFNSIDEAVAHFNLNHKVAKVEYINLNNEKVYDLSVDKYNNFYVDAGVVLHNCYRYSFQATQNKYDTYSFDKKRIRNPKLGVVDPQSIPANITNPNDSLGSSCKHVLLVLSNNSWLMKVASVINNYIKYMEKNYQKAYADIIYPAIYEKPYEDNVQITAFDSKRNYARTGKDTLSKAISADKDRDEKGRFAQGNKSGVKFQPKSDNEVDVNQISLFDEE